MYDEARHKRPAEIFVPDEILIYILIKLQVIDVARCQCVCRRWKRLISEQQFAESLLRNTAPMIFVQVLTRGRAACILRDGNFLLDNWWDPTDEEEEEKRLVIHKVCSFPSFGYDAIPWQNGFLLLKNSIIEFTIINPIIKSERVRIVLPARDVVTEIFGIFFHPLLKEYCTICQATVKNLPPNHNLNPADTRVAYKMLNLESTPCLRQIGELWAHYWIPNTSAVIVNDLLYWMVDHFKRRAGELIIMVFDIIKQEISLIPQPDTSALCSHLSTPTTRFYYPHMPTLFNNDGFLSLVSLSFPNNRLRIDIWTLKHQKGKVWTSLNYVLDQFATLTRPTNTRPVFQHLEAISFVHGEITFRWYNCTSTLYVCNLKRGTVKRLVLNVKLEKIPDGCRKMRSFSVSICPLRPCISNLKNCKPVIYVDEGKKEGKEKEEAPGCISLVKSIDLEVVEEKLLPL